MDRVALTLFALLLLLLAGWNLRLVWGLRTRGRKEKTRVFETEPRCILCLAGEADRDSWEHLHKLLLKSPHLACYVVSGPLSQIERSFQESPELNREEMRRRLRDQHPIFRLLRDKPAGTYRLFMRRQTSPGERHYAIGCSNRRMFLEWNHDDGTFRGGEVVTDEDTIREKEKEHERLRTQFDECREVTRDSCESAAFLRDLDFPFGAGTGTGQRTMMALGQ